MIKVELPMLQTKDLNKPTGLLDVNLQMLFRGDVITHHAPTTTT
jgi:hypothetical protein